MTEAPTTPDPIEIAMEAEAHGVAPVGAALGLLQDQRQLVRWQVANERAAFALRALTGVAGVAVAAVLVAMVWQAHDAGGLLVEPFSVPPDLAARGLTGEAVASQVLDNLARLNNQAVTWRRGSSYATDWGNNLNVAIPSTGVSIGELQTALRRWLGHETRITGEVYRTADGVAVAARASGTPAVVVRGADSDIEGLTAQAAREIYRITQPYRYGSWLLENQDAPAATAQWRALALSSAPDHERAFGYRSWANSLGNPSAAAPLLREALRLQPGMAMAWSSLGSVETSLGHREAGLRAWRNAERLVVRDPSVETWFRRPNLSTRDAAQATADYAVSLALSRQLRTNLRALHTNTAFAAVDVGYEARGLAGLHRYREAEALIANPGPIRDSQKIARVSNELGQARWILAYAREDWAALVAMAPSLQIFGRGPATRRRNLAIAQFSTALAMTGELSRAKSIAASMAPDCDHCALAAARVAAAAGDWPRADAAFARAVGLAPSIPEFPYQWGRSRLARGQAAEAVKLFRQAERLQPRWADPLKAEADAWMGLGKPKQAAKLYARAANLAPKWGGLRLAWGEALAKVGDRAEARVRFRAAAELDLSAVERARLVGEPA